MKIICRQLSDRGLPDLQDYLCGLMAKRRLSAVVVTVPFNSRPENIDFIVTLAIMKTIASEKP